MNPGYILSSEQLQSLEDNGYLMIKELFDSASLDKFRKRFKDICDGKINKNQVTIVYDNVHQEQSEMRINKVQELLYDEVFMQYSENPKVLSIVSQLIGDKITAVNSMFINKPPGTSRHPPHQDMYYFAFRPAEKIVAMWTAIDHATIDNGCLYVVPGSHKSKVILEHSTQKDAKKLFHYIKNEAIEASYDKRLYLDMMPGDTVFFSPFLVHGSAANMSKDYRKCLTVHYISSDLYFIDVRGTVHEQLAGEYNELMKKKGLDIDFTNLWRIKCKPLHNLKSNL